MNIKQAFNSIYSSSEKLTRLEAYQSRKYFVLEACTGGAIFNLVTGAFMAGFALYLGAGDTFTGLLAALPSLANVIQIVAPLVIEKLSSRKAFVTFLLAFYRVLMCSVVFIPLYLSGTGPRLTVFFVTVLMAFLFLSFAQPAFSIWIMSVVPENIRGKYFGLRDSYSMAVIAVVALCMGRVLDYFRNGGREYQGFLIVYLTALFFTIINFFSLSKIKEPMPQKSTMKLKLRDMFTIPLKNKGYMAVVGFFIIWSCGFNIAGPYFSIYMVKYLELDYTYIQLLQLITTGTSVIAVRFWGKFADRFSWTKRP